MKVKKYEELQVKYQKEIAALKEFEGRYEEAKSEADLAFQQNQHLIEDAETFQAQAGLDDEAADTRCDWADAHANLAHKIEHEYWDAFPKARAQGISRFYELAGLKH